MALSLQLVRALLDNDSVQIVINGTSYQGWTDVDIDSDILNPADAFSVSGTVPRVQPTADEVRAGAPPSAFDDFREGQACDVYVGLDRQMAGVIDEVDFTSSRANARIKISGRDKGAFVADSEAKHVRAAKYTVKSLIEALIEPSWGIRSVIFSNEENRKLILGKRDKTKPRSTDPDFLQPLPRERTKVDPGQRISAILDTHTRRLGITWWITAGGDLFIGKPNYKQEAAYNFTAGALDSDTPTNVESWDVKRSTADRFSEIKIVGQGFSQPKQIWVAPVVNPLAALLTPPITVSGKNIKFIGLARDPDLVERGVIRKKIISDCDILSNDEAQKRADWEMGRARLSGLVITVTVPGFRQGDRLYAVDTIATVKLEEADIDDSFYVMKRRFTEDRGKRRTTLTLMQKGVWLP